MCASASVCVFRLAVRVLLKDCVCVRTAVLHYFSYQIGGLEKWVSASPIVPSHCLSCSLFIFSFFPCSGSYSQVAPRIKQNTSGCPLLWLPGSRLNLEVHHLLFLPPPGLLAPTLSNSMKHFLNRGLQSVNEREKEREQ